MAIHGYVGLYGAMYGNVGLWSGLFRAMCSNVGLCTIVLQIVILHIN